MSISMQVTATGSSFGETTLRGWISIIWFTSALGVAGSEALELEAERQVLARCGDNVTLTCVATSSQQLDVKRFAWLGKNQTLCPQDDRRLDPGVLCEATATPPHELKATLLNVMPGHEGTYLCKLQSNLGVRSARSLLSVQDCLESSDSLVAKSHAECSFTGVYPRSSVHWFRGENNLTNSAVTREEEDRHGRYSLSSRIELEKGGSRAGYNCSLWVSDHARYLSSQSLVATEELTSSGSRVQLRWLGVLVEILLFKLMV